MSPKEFEPGHYTANRSLYRLISASERVGCDYFLPELRESVAILTTNEAEGRVIFKCPGCDKEGYVCRQKKGNGFRGVARVNESSCRRGRR